MFPAQSLDSDWPLKSSTTSMNQLLFMSGQKFYLMCYMNPAKTNNLF